MKRRILLAAVFIVLGVALNVAVAWGCALALDPMNGRQTISAVSTTPEWWQVARINRVGVTIVISARSN